MASFLSELASHTPLVILNLFQDNELPPPVILKQVQDDEILGVSGYKDCCE
jgi:hypothetical protein